MTYPNQQPYQQQPTMAGPTAGPSSARRGLGAYVTSGILLVLYGLVTFAWIGYGMVDSGTGPGTTLRLMFDWSTEFPEWILSPWDWALGIAFIIIGVIAIAGRDAARGGALVLGFVLIGVSLREVVGLFNADYRAEFGDAGQGLMVLVTRIFGLVVAVPVLVLMARARRRDRAWLPSRALRVAGVLIIVCVVAAIGEMVVFFTADSDWDLIRLAVDPAAFGGPDVVAHVYYNVAMIVAALVVGLLAIGHRRAARSAGAVVMAILGFFLLYYELLPALQTGNWNRYNDVVRAVLTHACAFIVIIGSVVVLVLLAATRDSESAAYGGQSYGDRSYGGQSYGDRSYGGHLTFISLVRIVAPVDGFECGVEVVG